MKKRFIYILFLLLSIMISGCNNKTTTVEENKSLWDFNTISSIKPEVIDAYYYSGNSNIKGIWFKGAEYNNKATKIFAWVGFPKEEAPANGYPAVVLVHGGLGQPFADWVELWNERGYVAIALSVDSNYSTETGLKENNPDGGPNISFSTSDMFNTKNSWEYISVYNIMMCHNILRQYPNVDKENIGITGISWGSFLTCATVGVDSRFKFAIPVYGAGYNYLDISSNLASVFLQGDEFTDFYTNNLDPSVYLKNANLDMLWITGINDPAFSIGCNQMASNLNKGTNRYSWRSMLVHGQEQGNGSQLPEIFDFADDVVNGTNKLFSVIEKSKEDDKIVLQIDSSRTIQTIKCYYSSYPLEYWHDQSNVWESFEIQMVDGQITINIPTEAVFLFVEVTDSAGYKMSSKMYSF